MTGSARLQDLSQIPEFQWRLMSGPADFSQKDFTGSQSFLETRHDVSRIYCRLLGVLHGFEATLQKIGRLHLSHQSGGR